MSIKQYNIKLPKQDYLLFSVSLKENGENIKLNDNDLMFMTVRQYATDKDYIFQKSLGNGITFNEGTKKYEIEINSEDTKNMNMTYKYGYDITIYYNGNKPKQKVIGEIAIGKKFTLNEVV